MRKGFTLIEVAVVIVVCLVLIALLLPAIYKVSTIDSEEISPVAYSRLAEMCNKNEEIRNQAKVFMQDGKITTEEYSKISRLNGRSSFVNSLKGN